MRSYHTCLSLSDLFHLAKYPLDLPMLSQMARFHILWLSNIPLCVSVHVYYICIYTQSFCIANEAITKMKRQPTEWKNILAKGMSPKELMSKIDKELIQLNIKKTDNTV